MEYRKFAIDPDGIFYRLVKNKTNDGCSECSFYNFCLQFSSKSTLCKYVNPKKNMHYEKIS